MRKLQTDENSSREKLVHTHQLRLVGEGPDGRAGIGLLLLEANRSRDHLFDLAQFQMKSGSDIRKGVVPTVNIFEERWNIGDGRK